MPAFDVLREYLGQRGAFSDDEFAFVESVFAARTLPAGGFLQRAGDVWLHAAFVASGCLRSYVIDAKGKEHIVQFAPETWWLADGVSLMSGTPSQYFVDAVEDSELLLLDGPSHQRLLNQVAGYAAAFQTGIQRHVAAKDQRIATALSSSAEERYQDFLKTYPSIAQRVPQFMLASYLGVSPETLSRIRRSRARK